MKRIDLRILVGALLIGSGVLFFLQTLNILSDAWSILWTAAFLLGSSIFFYIFFTDRRQWWALIPAVALLGLAGTIFVDTYFPSLSNLGGAIFLGSLGLGFFVRIYRLDQLIGFYFDQGRDALVIWRLWHEGKLFLIIKGSYLMIYLQSFY